MPACLLCAGLAAVVLACSDPPFEVVVTFPGSIGVEPEAPVYYRGVKVGAVDDVSLHQSSPRASARVALTLQIEDPSIVLREGDAFEVVRDGVLGSPAVQVTPAPDEAEPLVPGAVVEGVPPAVTRMRESVADALESLTDAAAQAADEVAAELSRSFGIPELDGPPPSEEDFEEEVGEPDPPEGQGASSPAAGGA